MTVGLMSAGGAVKKGKEKKKPQNPLQTFKKKSCTVE